MLDMMWMNQYIAIFFYIVLLDYLICSNEQDLKRCKQLTVLGSCCRLPFQYKGARYNSCTNVGTLLRSYYWCYYGDGDSFAQCKDPIYHPSDELTSIVLVTSSEITDMTSSRTGNADIIATTGISISESKSLAQSKTRPIIRTLYASLPQTPVYSSTPLISGVTLSFKSSSSAVILNQKPGKRKSEMNATLIAGVACAPLLVIVICITAVCYLKRNRRNKSDLEKSNVEKMPTYSSKLVTKETESPMYECVELDDRGDSESAAMVGKESNDDNDHLYQEVDPKYDPLLKNGDANDKLPLDCSEDGDKAFIHFNELYSST